MTLYLGQNARLINADLVRLDAARVQIESLIAGMEKVKESAILRDTQDAFDDLINSLIDAKGDLSHTILAAEDAASMRQAAE